MFLVFSVYPVCNKSTDDDNRIMCALGTVNDIKSYNFPLLKVLKQRFHLSNIDHPDTVLLYRGPIPIVLY